MDIVGQEPQIKVFLLDDHEVVRRGVAEVLESDPGITVVGEAKNAAEALARVPALRPDVAVLDVRLPDGDGLDLAAELQQGGKTRPIVVVLSASVLPSERDAALRSGADAFLAKPYHPNELVALVGRLLEGGTPEPV